MPDPETKAKVFEMLRAKGAFKAVLTYQGGNDEGGVDEINLYVKNPAGGDDGVIELDPYGRGFGGSSDLAELLMEPVESKYGSWAGEFSAYGTLVWDAEAGTVELSDNYMGEYVSSREAW